MAQFLLCLPLSLHALQRKEIVCLPLLREILFTCNSGGVKLRQLGQILDCLGVKGVMAYFKPQHAVLLH